jgi:hypothetical protein
VNAKLINQVIGMVRHLVPSVFILNHYGLQGLDSSLLFQLFMLLPYHFGMNHAGQAIIH